MWKQNMQAKKVYWIATKSNGDHRKVKKVVKFIKRNHLRLLIVCLTKNSYLCLNTLVLVDPC